MAGETGGEENRGVFQLEGTSALPLAYAFLPVVLREVLIADDSKTSYIIEKLRGEEESNLEHGTLLLISE